LVGTFAYDDTEVVQEATARFEAFKLDPNDVKSLPSDMRSSVFRIVLMNGGEKEYEDVKKYFYTAPDNAERIHVLGSLGHIKIDALKKATMEWSTSGEIKLQDFFYAMGSVGSSGKEGRDISWQYFQENFQKIKKMIEKASPSIMNACIVMCAGSFSSKEKADEIESFFETNPLPSSSRRISQLLEGMRANAQLLDVIPLVIYRKQTFGTVSSDGIRASARRSVHTPTGKTRRKWILESTIVSHRMLRLFPPLTRG
jgi:puromycin-sensitive aminopeptidase